MFLAGLIAKVLGAVYRLPLTWLLGAEGLGMYQLVYPLFSLILVLSSTGMPTAISRVTAGYLAKGDTISARKTLQISLGLLLSIGAIFALILVASSYFIALLQGNARLTWCYIALVPAILFVSVLSAFRGYFQGYSYMVPTAASQLIEQIAKLLCGLLLGYMLLPFGVEFGAIGALIGVSLSELLAMLMMLVFYRKFRRTSMYIEPLALANPHAYTGGVSSPNAQVVAVSCKSAASLGEAKDKKCAPLGSAACVLSTSSSPVCQRPIGAADGKREHAVMPYLGPSSAALAGEEFLSTLGLARVSSVGPREQVECGRGMGATLFCERKCRPAHFAPSCPRWRRGVCSSGLSTTPAAAVSIGGGAETRAVARVGASESLNSSDIRRNITKNVIPITLSNSILPTVLFVESLFVVLMLSISGLPSGTATALWGISSGVVGSLVNMPVVLTQSVAVAIVPFVAGNCAASALQSRFAEATSLVVMFCVPMILGFVLLGDTVLEVLYQSTLAPDLLHLATQMLLVMSPVVILMGSLLQTQNNMLQGLGYGKRTARHMLIAAIVQIALFVGLCMTSLNIWGCVLASMGFYIVAFVQNAVFIRSKLRLRVSPREWQPAIWGGVLVLLYIINIRILDLQPLLTLVLGVAGGAVLYLYGLWAWGGLDTIIFKKKSRHV